MPTTIWKFTLAVRGEQTIKMPEGAKILTLQVQGGVPCIWVLVDPKKSEKVYTLWTFGTGDWLPDGFGTYSGTYQLENGRLVFHTFIREEPSYCGEGPTPTRLADEIKRLLGYEDLYP